MSLKENLAGFLRSYMQKKGISATKLRFMLDISHNSLYAYLNCTGNPTISTIEYIAGKLNVSPVDIVMGEYDPDGQELSGLLQNTVRGVSELPQDGQYKFLLLVIREVMERWNKT